MRNALNILLLLALSGSPRTLRAEPAPDPVLDDYDRYQIALNDQPRELQIRTAARLARLTPEQDPVAWTKAFVAHLIAVAACDDDIGGIPQIEEKLQLAENLARAYELHPQMVHLMDIQIDRARQRPDPPTDAAIVARYEEAFAYADAHGVKREKGLMLAYYSNYLVEMGRGVDSLKSLDQAMKAMQSDPGVTEFDVVIIQGYMAVSMWYLGDFDKYVSYMDVVDGFCERKPIRSFCATQLYNLGFSFVENFSRQDFARAEQYFQRSMHLARSIEDDRDIALCRYGLGTLYLRQKKWVEAEKYLREARGMFARWDDRAFIAKTLVQLGQAQLGQKKFPETLATLEEARAFMRPEMKRDLNRIEEITYQVYKQSDRKIEALHALEVYLEGFKKVSEDLQKREYSKAVTTMGLQIEEAKNKALQAENDRKIRDLRRLTAAAIALAGMLILVAFSMLIAIRRGRQVRAAKEKMQRILDTIDEGILSVAADLTIVDEHSPFIQQIFPEQRLAGAPVMDTIFRPSTLNAEEIAITEQALRACLGEDSIAWEFNAVHLPREITRLDGRNLILHWMPITDGHHVRRLLLAIRDNTEQKMLQQKLEQQQRKIGEVLSGKFQEVRRLLERFGRQLPQFVADITHAEKITEILRNLHTLKGEARSLGLRDLSRGLHHLEDACRAPDSLIRQEALQDVRRHWDEYQHLVNTVFSLPPGEGRTADQLLDVVAPLASDLRKISTQSGLSFAGMEVLDHVESWTPALLDTARSVLVHGLTNAMDHGYLLPWQKQQKNGRPWFQVEAEEDAACISLTIRDQGSGLNWDALQTLARQRGFIPQDDETVVDIVFQDGLSTAGRITETSGRGVGLAAVRALCRQLGGDAHLTSNDRGPGAMLIMRYRKKLTKDLEIA